MIRKLLLSSPAADATLRKTLKHLYERRSTVEALIRSLELYDRCRDVPKARHDS